MVPDTGWRRLGSPETFFQKTVYTYSHDNSILAVAKGLVDGAAVDGHQWEYFQHFTPALTSRTRVIRKSEPYGSPPLVASSRLPEGLKTKIRGILLAMHQEPDGREILDKLLIDQFLAPREEWYEPVRAMIAGLPIKGDLPCALKALPRSCRDLVLVLISGILISQLVTHRSAS
jgi:phosphonate transport system substrate-binding protein